MSEVGTDTSERIEPGRQVSLRQHLLLLRHQFAYAFARSQLPTGARVIEIGCGTGYGSRLLTDADRANGAGPIAEYIGLDVDAATVDRASAGALSSRCRFERYDGRQLPFAARRFDVALSFQVIEHVDDDGRFVSEIRRVLADDGLLVLTTPNRLTRVAAGRRPWNRHHLREYTPVELSERLSGAFDRVELLGVRGSAEVERIERERLRAIRRMAAIDVFGLRDRISERLRQTVMRVVESRAPGADARVDRFDLGDFHASAEDLENCLDLLAVCRATA